MGRGGERARIDLSNSVRLNLQMSITYIAQLVSFTNGRS